jgi:osmotically-inducible protein OsmY
MANPYISDPKDVELEATISRAVRGMGSHLHVSVKSGHVFLSGVADDYGTKRDIVAQVRGVQGVHDLTNNIRVSHSAD